MVNHECCEVSLIYNDWNTHKEKGTYGGSAVAEQLNRAARVRQVSPTVKECCGTRLNASASFPPDLPVFLPVGDLGVSLEGPYTLCAICRETEALGL